MKSGRELDALVAEKVMRWKRVPSAMQGWSVGWEIPEGSRFAPGWALFTPGFSTSIEAAWEVVERIKAIGCVDIQVLHGGTYQVQIDRYGASAGWDSAFVESTEGESAPHAICLAALKSIGAI
jgi:hypothetical protein